MEMLIGKYKLTQQSSDHIQNIYVIVDTTAPDDKPTILSEERMLQVVEDIYTDYYE